MSLKHLDGADNAAKFEKYFSIEIQKLFSMMPVICLNSKRLRLFLTALTILTLTVNGVNLRKCSFQFVMGKKSGALAKPHVIASSVSRSCFFRHQRQFCKQKRASKTCF